MAPLTEDELWLEQQPRTLAERDAARALKIGLINSPEANLATIATPLDKALAAEVAALGVQGDIAQPGTQATLPQDILDKLSDQIDGPLDQSLTNLIAAHYAVFGEYPDFSLTADLLSNGEVKFQTYEEAQRFFEVVKESYAGTGREWQLDASRTTGKGMPVMGAEKSIQGTKFTPETDVLDPEMIASFRPKKIEDFLYGPYMKRTKGGKSQMFRDGVIRLDEMLIALPKQWAISQLSTSLGREARLKNPDIDEDEALMRQLNVFLSQRVPEQYAPAATAAWQDKTEAAMRFLQMERAAALYVATAEGGEPKGEQGLQAAAFLQSNGYGSILTVLDQQIRQAAMPSGGTPEAQRKAVDANAAWVEQMWIASRNPGVSERVALHQLHDLNPNATTLATQKLVGRDNMMGRVGFLTGWLGHVPGGEELGDVAEAGFGKLKVWVPALAGEINDVIEGTPGLHQVAGVAKGTLAAAGGALGMVGDAYAFGHLALVNLQQVTEDWGRQVGIPEALLTPAPIVVPEALGILKKVPYEQSASHVRQAAFAEYIAAHNKKNPDDIENMSSFVGRWKSYWHNNQDAKDAGVPMQYTDEIMRIVGFNPAENPEASFVLGFAYETLMDLALFKGAGAAGRVLKATKPVMNAAESSRLALNVKSTEDLAVSLAERSLIADSVQKIPVTDVMAKRRINLVQPKGTVGEIIDEKSWAFRMNSILGGDHDSLAEIAVRLNKRQMLDGSEGSVREIIREALPKITDTGKGPLNPDSWAIFERAREIALYDEKSIFYRGKHPMASYFLEKTYNLRRYGLTKATTESSAQRVASQIRTAVGKEEKGFQLAIDELRRSQDGIDTVADQILENLEKSRDINQLADYVGGRFLLAEDTARSTLKKAWENNQILALRNATNEAQRRRISAETFETLGKSEWEKERLERRLKATTEWERQQIDKEEFIPDLGDIDALATEIKSQIATAVDDWNKRLNWITPVSKGYEKRMSNLEKQAWLGEMKRRKVRDLDGTPLRHIPIEAERRGWQDRQMLPEERVPLGVKDANDLAKEDTEKFLGDIRSEHHNPDAVFVPSQAVEGGVKVRQETSKVFRFDLRDETAREIQRLGERADELRRGAGLLTQKEAIEADENLDILLRGIETAKKNRRKAGESVRQHDERVFNLLVDEIEMRAHAAVGTQVQRDMATLVVEGRKAKRAHAKLQKELEEKYKAEVTENYNAVRSTFSGLQDELEEIRAKMRDLQMPDEVDGSHPTIIRGGPEVPGVGPVQTRGSRLARDLADQKRQTEQLKRLLYERRKPGELATSQQTREWVQEAEKFLVEAETSLRRRLNSFVDLSPAPLTKGEARKVLEEEAQVTAELSAKAAMQEAPSTTALEASRYRGYGEATNPPVEVPVGDAATLGMPHWVLPAHGMDPVEAAQRILDDFDTFKAQFPDMPPELLETFRFNLVQDLQKTVGNREYAASMRRMQTREFHWANQNPTLAPLPRINIVSLPGKGTEAPIYKLGDVIVEDPRFALPQKLVEELNVLIANNDMAGARDRIITFIEEKILHRVVPAKQTGRQWQFVRQEADRPLDPEDEWPMREVGGATAYRGAPDNRWLQNQRDAAYEEVASFGKRVPTAPLLADQDFVDAIDELMHLIWEEHINGRAFNIGTFGPQREKNIASFVSKEPDFKDDLALPMFSTHSGTSGPGLGGSKWMIEKRGNSWVVLTNEAQPKMAVRYPHIVDTTPGKSKISSPYRIHAMQVPVDKQLADLKEALAHIDETYETFSGTNAQAVRLKILRDSYQKKVDALEASGAKVVKGWRVIDTRTNTVATSAWRGPLQARPLSEEQLKEIFDELTSINQRIKVIRPNKKAKLSEARVAEVRALDKRKDALLQRKLANDKIVAALPEKSLAGAALDKELARIDRMIAETEEALKTARLPRDIPQTPEMAQAAKELVSLRQGREDLLKKRAGPVRDRLNLIRIGRDLDRKIKEREDFLSKAQGPVADPEQLRNKLKNLRAQRRDTVRDAHVVDAFPESQVITGISEGDVRQMAAAKYREYLEELPENEIRMVLSEGRSKQALVIDGDLKETLHGFLVDFERGTKHGTTHGIEEYKFEPKKGSRAAQESWETSLKYQPVTPDIQYVVQDLYGRALAEFIKNNIGIRAPMAINTPEVIALLSDRSLRWQRAGAALGRTQRDMWNAARGVTETARPKVKLTGKGTRLAKDQKKADKATKFIGRGTRGSSTWHYANDFGALANTGQYSAEDVVFVSVNGARRYRSKFDPAEVLKALKAKATIITDNVKDRLRDYNVGERELAAFLEKHAYREVEPGKWESVEKMQARFSRKGKKAGAWEIPAAGVTVDDLRSQLEHVLRQIDEIDLDRVAPAEVNRVRAFIRSEIGGVKRSADYTLYHGLVKRGATKTADQVVDELNSFNIGVHFEDANEMMEWFERNEKPMAARQSKASLTEEADLLQSQIAYLERPSYSDVYKRLTAATDEDLAAFEDGTITAERLNEIATPRMTDDIMELHARIAQSQIGLINLQRQQKLMGSELASLQQELIVAEQKAQDTAALLQGGLVRNNSSELQAELERRRAFLNEAQKHLGDDSPEREIRDKLIEQLDDAAAIIDELNADPEGVLKKYPLRLDSEGAMEWQTKQWHYAAFNYSKLSKFRAGGAIKAMERFNSWKMPGINWSIDDWTTLYKTIVMMKVSTMLRIPLADEATRFITEGINPLEAWRKSHILRDLDKMPDDIQFKVSQLLKAATDGPYSYIDYAAKDSFTHYQKILGSSRRDPTFARFLDAKRMLDPRSGVRDGRQVMREEIDAFLKSNKPTEKNLRTIVQTYMERAARLDNPEAEFFKAWYVMGFRRGGGLRRVGKASHRFVVQSDDGRILSGGLPGDVTLQHLPNQRYVNVIEGAASGPAKRAIGVSGGVKGDAQGLVDALYDWYEYWYTHPTLGKHWQPKNGWANTEKAAAVLRQGKIPDDLLFGKAYDGLFEAKEAKKAWASIGKLDPAAKEVTTWDNRVIPSSPDKVREWQPQLWGQRTFSGENPNLVQKSRDAIYGILDYAGSKMNEMVYADHFSKQVELLTADAKKNLGRQLTHAELDVIDRKAHFTARAYMERVMFTNVTYGGEEFLRNLIMFLPAYRQFATYWVPYLAKHPFALALAARLNREKEHMKVQAGGFQFDLSRMSFLINQSDTAESPIKNFTGWLPSGAPLITMPVSFGAHVTRGDKDSPWGKLAGNWPFEFAGEFSALNSPFDKIVYGATGWTLPWPFGSDPTKNAWRAIQIQNEALRNHDKRISGKEAYWKVRLGRLWEGGWNFVSPVGGRIVDTDIEAMMKGKLAYNQAKNPTEVAAVLKQPEMKIFKTYLEWQNLPSYEQLDFMAKHPEIVPYAVSGYTAGSNPSGAVGLLYSSASESGVPDPEAYVQRVDEKYRQLNKVLQAEKMRKDKDDEYLWWDQFKKQNADLHEIARLQNEWETSTGAFGEGGNFYIQGKRGLAWYQSELNQKYLGISDPYTGISNNTGDAYRLAKFMDELGGAGRALLQMSPNYEMYVLQKNLEQQQSVTNIVKGYVEKRMSTRLTREQIQAAGYTLEQADDLYATTKVIDRLWNGADAAASKYQGGFTSSEGRAIRKAALEKQNALIKSNELYAKFFGDNAAALFYGTYLTKPAYTRSDYVRFDQMDKAEVDVFKHLMTEKDPDTGQPRLTAPYLPKNAAALRQNAETLGYVPKRDATGKTTWFAKVALTLDEVPGKGANVIVGLLPAKAPAEAKQIQMNWVQTHEVLADALTKTPGSLVEVSNYYKGIETSKLPKWAKDMAAEDLRAGAWQAWLTIAGQARAELRDTPNEFYGGAPGYSTQSKFGASWKEALIGFGDTLSEMSPGFAAEWNSYNKENEMVNAILNWYL